MVPIRVTDSRNVLLKCRHSMLQWFDTMLLPDMSFLLNVINIHSVLLSMIRSCCCCCSELEWWVFFGQNEHFCTSRYLVLILLWVTYYYWMVQHLTDQYTHLKVQEMHSFMLAFFFLSHPRVFSAHDFVKLPPFRNSYPGSHGTHSSPFPTTVLAFVLVAKKKGSELGFLPWRPLTSTWCAFMQPTSIVRSTQAARRSLRSVCMLMLSFQA